MIAVEVSQKVPHRITDVRCGAYLAGKLEPINQHIIQSIDLMDGSLVIHSSDRLNILTTISSQDVHNRFHAGRPACPGKIEVYNDA